MFGSRSLIIHQSQCLQLWIAREGRKPKAEQRSPPQPPESFSHGLPKSGGGILAFNADMLTVFNESSLIECPFCHHRFEEAPFRIHSKVRMALRSSFAVVFSQPDVIVAEHTISRTCASCYCIPNR
jgi:hypothetical protein